MAKSTLYEHDRVAIRHCNVCRRRTYQDDSYYSSDGQPNGTLRTRCRACGTVISKYVAKLRLVPAVQELLDQEPPSLDDYTEARPEQPYGQLYFAADDNNNTGSVPRKS